LGELFQAEKFKPQHTSYEVNNRAGRLCDSAWTVSFEAP